MNRPPSSRGGAPILGTLRPMTGQRGMLSSSSGRPGTNRLKTGQPPSTPGQSAGLGVSLNTEVQVTERPVTQQGMMGMRLGTGGPGRQVQDSSYFMGKLHQKIAELTSEIDKFNKEIDQDSKDKSQFSQLERKYDSLIREVRQLEGQLADYNLAMDKLRSSVAAVDILDYKDLIHQRNLTEAMEIDKIFLQRQECERIGKDIENQIQRLYQEQETKMSQLDPVRLNKYKELVQENTRLESEIVHGQQEMDMILHRIKQKESELENDQWRNEYVALEKQYLKLKKEKMGLEMDVQTSQMNPEEARASMLAKVKEDNARMAIVEQRLVETNDELSKMQKGLMELKMDIEERKGDQGDTQKFEMLLQRDQEMSVFMNTFESKKEKELQQQKETQETILTILEHISQGLEREGNMPSQEKFKDLQGDLNFKEKQLQTAQSTKQRLEQELQKRYSELEKINSLDDKISVELNALNDKINTMTSDMIEFENIDSLKVNAETTKQMLLKMKQKYIRRRDAMKQQLHSLNSKHEKLKNESNEDETAKTLEDLEVKLRRHEETIYHMRDFIHKKNAETDYQSTKNECFQILQDVNNAVIKIQTVAINVGY